MSRPVTDTGFRPRRAATVLLALILAGCGVAPSMSPSGSVASSTSASASPAAEPVLGRDWGKAGLVEQPGSGAATTPPYVNPGSLGHPQHYQGGEADLLAVTRPPTGLVAVGYLARDITADAWHSADGLAWRRVTDFPSQPGSLARAVAAGNGRIVAVGESGGDAMAWVSDDGRSWRSAPPQPSLHEEPGLRMTAVVALRDGFVAGGYVGTLVGTITAAFWTSRDGLAWSRVPDGEAYANARVTALAVSPDRRTLVAVGAAGDARSATGSAVWTSPDGHAWSRVAAADDLAGAVMHAVTAGDGRFAAVGNTVDSTRGVTWTSADGRTWERGPDAPSLDNFGLKIEIHGVAFDGSMYAAGGHRLFGTQFPTAVTWTSTDATHWERGPETAALSQGRIEAVTTGGPGFVAVGDFGSPDFAIPTVWVTPGR